MVAIPLLTEKLLSDLDLAYTWYVLAGLSFLTIIAGATFKPRLAALEKKSSESQYGSKIREHIGLDVFKNREFVLWSFASFIGIFGNLIPIITMAWNCNGSSTTV